MVRVTFEGQRKGVLLFPKGTQFLRTKGSEDPRIKNPKTIRFFWRLSRFLPLWVRGTFSPFYESSALFQFLTLPIFIFVASIVLGEDGMSDEINTLATAGIAAFLALPIWILIQLVVTPIKQRKLEREEGEWNGDRFVYHEPRRVLTCEWSTEENGHVRVFDVPDVPDGALVDYKIDLDGPADRIGCMVVGDFYFVPYEPLLKERRFAPRGKVRLRPGRLLGLACHSQKSTLPAIVRVYLLAWEINFDVCLEHTDPTTKTRYVLSPPDDEHSDEQKTS